MGALQKILFKTFWRSEKFLTKWRWWIFILSQSRTKISHKKIVFMCVIVPLKVVGTNPSTVYSMDIFSHQFVLKMFVKEQKLTKKMVLDFENILAIVFNGSITASMFYSIDPPHWANDEEKSGIISREKYRRLIEIKSSSARRIETELTIEI